METKDLNRLKVVLAEKERTNIFMISLFHRSQFNNIT